MTMPLFDVAAPRTVREACRLLAEAPDGAEPLAGGTELLPALRHQTRHPGLLVDLAKVEGLDGLTYSPDRGLSIGARVTLKRLIRDASVGLHYPSLAEASRVMGTPQLQMMGTVAGNLCQDTCCLYIDRSAEQRDGLETCHKIGGQLCHAVGSSDLCWATYNGDLAPVLLALGATITVADADTQDVWPLERLYTLDGKTPLALRPDQIVTRIDVPPPARRSGATYLKLRQRGSLDYPLLGVAVAVELDDDDRCVRAAVALTGVDRGPILIERASRLVGGAPTDERIDEVAKAAYKRARPIKNVWGYSVNYRMKMVLPYTTRALKQAFELAARDEDRHA